MILRAIVIVLPKRRQMHGYIHLVGIPHRICRIRNIFLIEFIISVTEKIVRNALTFCIQTVYIEIHSFRQISTCRILPHIFSDFLVSDIVFKRANLIRFPTGHLIGQLQLLLLYLYNRFYGGAHIAHILYGFFHFFTGALRFFFLIDDRSVPYAPQSTVYPTCRVSARPVIDIQLCLYQAEPFGIRILADIHR